MADSLAIRTEQPPPNRAGSRRKTNPTPAGMATGRTQHDRRRLPSGAEPRRTNSAPGRTKRRFSAARPRASWMPGTSRPGRSASALGPDPGRRDDAGVPEPGTANRPNRTRSQGSSSPKRTQRNRRKPLPGRKINAIPWRTGSAPARSRVERGGHLPPRSNGIDREKPNPTPGGGVRRSEPKPIDATRSATRRKLDPPGGPTAHRADSGGSVPGTSETGATAGAVAPDAGPGPVARPEQGRSAGRPAAVTGRRAGPTG